MSPEHQDTPAEPVLRAVSETGTVALDPSAEELLGLLVLVDGGEGNHLVLARVDDAQTYVQAARNGDGRYLVEHRDGGPDRHFATVADDVGEAYRLMAEWSSGDDGWRTRVTWEQITF
ncbi:MAG: hypothetical protein Q7T56_09565 [Nocardioidaceae bacterium]|nr:hypothetical protein [Nocardioidaceae bacterium]